KPWLHGKIDVQNTFTCKRGWPSCAMMSYFVNRRGAMWSRRSILRLAGTATGAAFAARRYGIEEVAYATAAVEGRSPEDVAADETYWRDIQFAFTLDRTLINLNNGNQCPSPTVVHEACKRYMDSSNQAPVYHRGLIE